LFNECLQEIKVPGLIDKKQKELLREIQTLTKRRLVSYLANPANEISIINGQDKAYIVSLVNSIPEDIQELDFMVLSPGGFAEAVEAIVKTLRNRFKDIRFIVPNYAKSAATMLCLSGDALVMKDSAELGPIDPQIRTPQLEGPAAGILEGFEEIRQRVEKEGKLNGAYIPLLNKMDFALIKTCENAIAYGRTLVENWLKEYMFKGDPKAEEKAKQVVDFFGSKEHLSHGKPLFRDDIRKGCCLPIQDLEDLGDAAGKIWEYHYRFEFIFLNNSAVAKIFHSDGEYMVIRGGAVQLMMGPPGPPVQPLARPTPKQESTPPSA